MRAQDIGVFRACAHQFRLWILVRATSAEIMGRHVGLSDRVPKPVTCKAKTADVESHSLAGLVVNPHTRPDAFSAKRTPTAIELWREMASVWLRRPEGALVNAPPGSGAPFDAPGGGIPYEVAGNAGDLYYGCLLVHTPPCPGRCKRPGCARKIHGDYDLYDIIDPKLYRENVASPMPRTRLFTDMQSPYVEPVASFVNQAIGVPMIQHGAQLQYSGHSNEPLDVFSPKGKHSRTTGLLDNEALYAVTFRGREEGAGH